MEDAEMADACLMLTYITISTRVLRISSRPYHALITLRKDLIEGMEMADACLLVTHLANSITGRLSEHHRVVTAF